MSTPPPATDAWASRMVRTTLGLATWTIAWVASLALAAFGPGAIWNNQVGPTLLAIGLNVAVGIGMLYANKRQLDGLDELQRTTQLQAMALALGVGLVGGLAWTLFDRHGLVAFDVEIAHLVILMAVVYMAASIGGTLRYR